MSVECNSALAVEIGSAPHASLVSSEGEHGERNWDGQIDSNLAGFNLSLELASGMSILREDRSSITPLVRIGEVDSILEAFSTDDLHDWSEDFFFVAVNALANVVDDGWTNPITFRVSLNLVSSAVKKEFAILSTVFDQTLNLSQVFCIVHRANISIVPTCADCHRFRLLNDLRNPFSRITDQDYHGKGHASLARGAEACADDSIDGISLISVWHHDAVVLCTHVDLGTLSMSAGSLVNVLSSRICSNEADTFDVWVLADLCDSISTSLDNIDHTIGDA